MEINRTIRINALNSLYGRVPYQFAVKRKNDGKFLTGQEDILTEDQMFKKVPLTKDNIKNLQMGDNPWIIDPNEFQILINGRKFDLSYEEDSKGNRTYKNPKDYAEFNFFKLQPEVITDKSKKQKHKNFFYIEDKEKIAVSNITHQDRIFEANQFVRSDTSIKRLKDIALLVSHIGNYNINPDLISVTSLQSQLYNICNSDPQTILACKSGEDSFNEEKLFALKVLKTGEVKFEKGSYFYGKNKEFVGDSFGKLIAWLKDPKNSQNVSRLGSIIKEEDDKEVM